MTNNTIKNQQVVEVATVDEFVSQLYAIMKRDQLENKNLIFGFTNPSVASTELVTTQSLKITEGKEEVVIELI